MHSGDSSCVLPAPSLSPAHAATRSSRSCARSAARSASSACSTSSSRSPRTARSTCSRRTRAPRAPCRSCRRRRACNLVAAACRLAAGATLADLGLPRRAAAAQCEREGRGAPVRALPRQRPGARAGDALDRRGDGERRRPPDRAREGRARRRARRCRSSGAAFLSVATADKRARRADRGDARRARLPACTRRTAPPRRSTAPGSTCEEVRRSSEADGDEPTVIDLIRRGRCDLVINTPAGPRRALRRLRDPRGGARPRACRASRRISGAAAAVHAIANARAEQALSLQERIDVETRTA